MGKKKVAKSSIIKKAAKKKGKKVKDIKLKKSKAVDLRGLPFADELDHVDTDMQRAAYEIVSLRGIGRPMFDDNVTNWLDWDELETVDRTGNEHTLIWDGIIAWQMRE